MEALQEIMAKLSLSTGSSSREMTDQEWEQVKADNFNSSAGSMNEEDDHDCPICKNKGLVMRAHQLENGSWSTVSSECKCMKVRRTIRRMMRSGLKNIIRDYTFDKFHATEEWQKTLKQAAVEYAANPEGWFFVGGQSGSGKTHLCTAICRDFLLRGKTVQYMLWRDDIVKIKSVANDSEAYSSAIEKYKRVEVLYIDDLFKTGKGADGEAQRPTAADVNVAFEILNYRYNDPKLLTIISSECTIDDLLGIDEAVGGRIFERAKVFSLKRDRRKNYRLKGAVEL